MHQQDMEWVFLCYMEMDSLQAPMATNHIRQPGPPGTSQTEGGCLIYPNLPPTPAWSHNLCSSSLILQTLLWHRPKMENHLKHVNAHCSWATGWTSWFITGASPLTLSSWLHWRFPHVWTEHMLEARLFIKFEVTWGQCTLSSFLEIFHISIF